MITLENSVALVTGAGRGIGRAVAAELAALGVRVAMSARTRSELEEGAAGLSGAVVLPADVRREADVRELVAETGRRLGPVDVVVNSAGVSHYGPVTEAETSDFDTVLETNLRGTFFVCRSVLPHMIERKRGHIINIASIAGKVGTARRSIYCASKFGVVGFSQALAEEVREHGIRVSVLCPGSTNTAFSPDDRPDKASKSTERMLQPADVAHAVRMIVAQQPNSFISEIVMRPTRKP